MAQSNQNAKLKDKLTCPVCFELFNEDTRLPKGLPCFHTFCLSCLASFIKEKQRSGDILQCPLCNTGFSLPRGGARSMPTNIGLKDMLELLPTEWKVSGAGGASHPMCVQHGKKECVFICRPCQVGLCNSCMTNLTQGPHADHRIEELDIVVERMKRDLTEKTNKMNKLKKECETMAEEAISKTLSWKNEQTTTVYKIKEQVLEDFKEWENAVNTQVSSIFQHSVTSIHELKNSNHPDIKFLEPALKHLKQMVDAFNFAGYEAIIGDIIRKIDLLDRDVLAFKQALHRKIPQNKLSAMCPAVYSTLDDSTGQLGLVINDVETFGNLPMPCKVYSQHWFTQKKQWRLMAQLHNEAATGKSLGVYLECESIEHSCMMNVHFVVHVINHVLGKPPTHVKILQSVYSANCLKNGIPVVMPWAKLVDPTEGFLKDNSIMLKGVFCVMSTTNNV